MESYSSSKIYSSSFFSSSSSSFDGHDHQHDEKKEKPYLSFLRTVRSLPSKPITITKKPIALSHPIIPPKIYRVEAVNFRQVVQMLTAAPEFQSHSNSIPTSGSTRLPKVAPPPLDLSSSPTSLSSNMSPIGGEWRDQFLPPSSSVVMSTDEASNDSTIEAQERHVKSPIPSGACSPMAFPQSPSSFAWCSSLLSSPDTLTSLDSSAVL